MSKPKRHLHENYENTYCGRDASHILMTYDEKEATCKTCVKGRAAAKEAERRSG